MTAPYCAVDFPPTGQPLPAAALWTDDISHLTLAASHDRWHTGPNICSGWIDVTATTLTPLFTGTTADDEHSLRLGASGPFVIPDSALTGLLRNTVRIITGGRVGPISTPALFLRAPVSPGDDDCARKTAVEKALHDQYKQQAGMPLSRPDEDRKVLRPGTREVRTLTSRAGFLKFFGQEAKIAPLGPGADRAGRGQELKLPLTMEFGPLAANLALDGIEFRYPPDPGHNDTNEEASNTYAPSSWHGDLHGKTVAICYGDNNPVTRRVWGIADIGTRNAAAAMQEARTRAMTQVAAIRARTAADPTLTPMEVNTGQFRTCTAVLWFTGVTGEPRSKVYLFPEPENEDAYTEPVPLEMIQLFESAAQLTRWQKDSFPGPDPTRDGYLDRRKAQPIWYTLSTDGNKEDVVAFGRSGGFRVAITHRDKAATETLLDGIPSGLRPRSHGLSAPLDVTEALFGAVDTDEPTPSFRRRLRVSTATPRHHKITLEDPVEVQLLSPQRGCFSHYLLQRNGQIITWADTDATLRGYKQYLHRWDSSHTGTLQERLPALQGRSQDAGRRKIHPIAPGNTFTFRITLTNLTRQELGCLLLALQLDNPAGGGTPHNPTSAHKMGLGKGIGFGSMHLAYTLNLIDPLERYAPKDHGQLPHPAAGVSQPSTTDIGTLIDDFGRALANHYGNADPGEWKTLRHLRQLRAATAWNQRLRPTLTATMPLNPPSQNPQAPAFSKRLSLPDILDRH